MENPTGSPVKRTRTPFRRSHPRASARRRWLTIATAGLTVAALSTGYAVANPASVAQVFGKTGGSAGAAAGAATAAGAGGGQGGKDTQNGKGATGVPAVVKAANAFLATLSDTQKAAVVLPFTEENATAWSNLPCGSSCRPGIQLGTLSDVQLAAAKKMLKAAMGTSTGTGYDQAMQILLADDVLGSAQGTGGGPGGTPPGTSSAPATTTTSAAATETTTAEPTTSATEPTTTSAPTETTTSSAEATTSAPPAPTGTPTGLPPTGTPPTGGNGGGGYSSGLYFLALLGTPSVNGTWQLHFGGHHLAVDLTYRKGRVAGSTPYFVGVEPTSWTAADGTTYAPMDIMRDRMKALTTSLNTQQLPQAKLAQSFTDVLVGPGKDGQFPETKAGLAVAKLSPAQKKLVLAAIHPWVAVVDNATAAQVMKTYEKELDKTYIGYSGGTGLDTQGDYVRIDGPGVWIEFVCQNGVVFQGKIHYHTVYRDHRSDYGGEFTF